MSAWRVLLVEDDPADAFLVQEHLSEAAPGLKVVVAGSVIEALDRGLLGGCACVLLDLNVPGSNGLDGLRALLRADPGAAVCVLTGLDDEHLGIAAVAEGAQDYLVKGRSDGPVLIRAIRYAVERRRAEASLMRLHVEQRAAAESLRLERGLLPKPLLDGSTVAAVPFYRPGRTRAAVGGDFYDAVLGPSGTVHAIVGDVAGHGPDEAALGALLRVSWRALVLAGVDEAEVLPKLQQVLVSERHERSLFTTVCTVAVRRGGGAEVTVRLAGHPPPVLLRPGPARLGVPVGPPLGIVSTGSWRPWHTRVAPGWALMLHTDGLMEGRGRVPGELLWEEGLHEVLAEEAGVALPDLPARLVERAEEINGGPLVDDVAILLLSDAAGGMEVA
ncbi:PP2C family protein-serine/threonine phosphatase [Pseudonocardia sp.]|uniref:PP2C family protein-serine/threonine phosphatase n=1 Tax=Pseudonocardia sp. TaxID=60912 RepID=UPI003D0B306A